MRAYSWILVLCAACSSPEDIGTAPVDSLIIEVFVDVYLLNARTELGYGHHALPLDSIMARHGLSREQYQNRVELYTEHPDVYLAVLNRVTERIGQESHLFSSY